VSDKHSKHKSKYTADRMIPGAFGGRDGHATAIHDRNRAHAGAIAAGAFTLPALGFALGPVFKSTPHTWETVGTASDSPEDNYTPVIVTLTAGIGEAGKTTVYVRKFNPTIDTDPYDRSSQYIAISSRCAHLGCPVRWWTPPSASSARARGRVRPARQSASAVRRVRPLDRFYTRVSGEAVQIGPRFSVNSELRRFSPRDPGEPIDGIGQYLYPSRPTAQKP